MRSRQKYILTKDEVHGYANHWLSSALRLEYEARQSHLIFSQYRLGLERSKGLALIPSWSTNFHGGFFDVAAARCSIHTV